jgi:hypothetical protein
MEYRKFVLEKKHFTPYSVEEIPSEIDGHFVRE